MADPKNISGIDVEESKTTPGKYNSAFPLGPIVTDLTPVKDPSSEEKVTSTSTEPDVDGFTSFIPETQVPLAPEKFLYNDGKTTVVPPSAEVKPQL